MAGLLESERVRLERARTEVAMAVRTGDPAEEIVAFAAMRKPDLVILGSRPATSPGPGFSGSVASKVARYSPSSVLIARDGRPVGSVVLGYDASPDAETALSLLAELPFRSPAPDSRLYCVRGPSTPLIWDCTDPPGRKSGRCVTRNFRKPGWRPRHWPTTPPRGSALPGWTPRHTRPTAGRVNNSPFSQPRSGQTSSSWAHADYRASSASFWAARAESLWR